MRPVYGNRRAAASRALRLALTQQNCVQAAKFLFFGCIRAPDGAEQGGRTMRAPRLDRIDRHILRLLQADGRMTNIALAERVGISPPPCLRRVRALEAAGFIRGYHADLAAEALGF